MQRTPARATGCVQARTVCTSSADPVALTQAPQNSRMFTLANGKANGEGYLVKICHSGRKLVRQLLAALDAENKVIDGIRVQNASGAGRPAF